MFLGGYIRRVFVLFGIVLCCMLIVVFVSDRIEWELNWLNLLGDGGFEDGLLDEE